MTGSVLSHRLVRLVFVVPLLLVVGCDSGRGGSDSAAMPIDSTELVRRAVRAVCEAPGVEECEPMMVLRFHRDSTGVTVALVPKDQDVVGGGGIVVLSTDGKVKRVELGQ